MSKTSMYNLLSAAVPRWALVILSGIGVFYLADLHYQIRKDHEMLLRHEVEIKEIQKAL